MTELTDSPVSLRDRADILDILRGFALLGIFLDNIFGFTGYSYATTAMRDGLSTASSDRVLTFAEYALVHGKFYSLFSLLFGIGFSIILLKARQKKVSVFGIFYRRLFILLLIGSIHMFLLWEGDILFTYAIVGMLLPLFMKCSNRMLIILAIIFIASPMLIDLFKVAFNFRTAVYFEKLGMKTDEINKVPLDDSFRLFLFREDSGWNEWRRWQASGAFYRLGSIIETNRIPKVLGLFLLGFYAGRKLIYARLEYNTQLLRKIRFWGLMLGIPLGITYAYFESYQKDVPDPIGLFRTFFYMLSVVPLSLGYASVICLWWIQTKERSILKWLKAPGRMALTNYLMQSVLGIGIFYGVGLGLGGNLGPTIFFPVAIAIYILQVIASNWWMKHFQFGPIEWIWRQLTYLKRLPIKNP